jgi:phosphoribosylformylglycinamidine synthase
VVGILEDASKVVSAGFKEEGNPIVLIGESKEEIGASEYLKSALNWEKGLPPQIDLEEEKRVQEFCLEAISSGIIQSAHDVSEGGLAFCVAECCFLNDHKLGCHLELKDEIRTDALLFGETQSRIIFSIQDQNLPKLLQLAQERRVRAAVIGHTGGESLVIRHLDKEVVNISLEEAHRFWKETLPEVYKIK